MRHIYVILTINGHDPTSMPQMNPTMNASERLMSDDNHPTWTPSSLCCKHFKEAMRRVIIGLYTFFILAILGF